MATKTDLEDERHVTTEEGIALARNFKLPFIEVSAKLGKNVKEGFELLVKEIHVRFETKGEVEGLETQKLIGKSEGGKAKNCAC